MTVLMCFIKMGFIIKAGEHHQKDQSWDCSISRHRRAWIRTRKSQDHFMPATHFRGYV